MLLLVKAISFVAALFGALLVWSYFDSFDAPFCLSVKNVQDLIRKETKIDA